jgi:hypothetical protein
MRVLIEIFLIRFLLRKIEELQVTKIKANLME